MQKANVAPLRGGALLAFRGAVIFSLLHLCFDMVEVGGSNPLVLTLIAPKIPTFLLAGRFAHFLTNGKRYAP